MLKKNNALSFYLTQKRIVSKYGEAIHCSKGKQKADVVNNQIKE